MRAKPYNLAIETTTRSGSVSLGQEDQLIDTARLSGVAGVSGVSGVAGGAKGKATPPVSPGNRLDLMPTIDRLMRQHGASPSELGQVYISIGPGSFTGLRIAVSTAKAIARVLGVRLVAVSTLEAVARNAPAPDEAGLGPRHLAVCLNRKRQTVYAQLFHYREGNWLPSQAPATRTMQELMELTPRPVAIIGDPIPEIPDHLKNGVTLLPPPLAIARSEAVWEIGRTLAKRNHFTDPLKLLPVYARPPEAQELWDQRHGKASHPKHPATQEVT